MTKDIYILLEGETIVNNIYINNQLYQDLSARFQLWFINITNLKIFTKDKFFFSKQHKKNNKFKYLDIINVNHFNSFFFKKKNSIIIPNFGKLFNFFLLYFLIKKHSLKQIIIQNIGFVPGNINFTKGAAFKNFNIGLIMRYVLIRKFSYLLYRFFILLGLFSPICIRFVSNRNFIAWSKNSFFQKLYKKTSINFIEYEETILVNSRINDLKLDTKLDISQEYITFIDSPLNHGDNVMVDGYIHENVHKIFYGNLSSFLKLISKFFNKKVIICSNPKYSILDTKKNFPSFKVVERRTPYYVYKSYIVCFLDSSALFDAILLKKRIISINSNIIGKNYFRRNNIYKELLNLFQHNIDKKFTLSKDELNTRLNKIRKKNYNKFIKNHLSYYKKTLGSDQIMDRLERI